MISERRLRLRQTRGTSRIRYVRVLLRLFAGFVVHGQPVCGAVNLAGFAASYPSVCCEPVFVYIGYTASFALLSAAVFLYH